MIKMILFVIVALVCTSQALPSSNPQHLVVAENFETSTEPSKDIADAHLTDGTEHIEGIRLKRSLPLYCIDVPTLDGLNVVLRNAFKFTIALSLSLTDGRYLPMTPPTKGNLTYFRSDTQYDYYVYSEDGHFYITIYDRISDVAVVNFTSNNVASIPEEAEFDQASLVKVTTLVFGHPYARNASGVYLYLGQSYNGYPAYQLHYNGIISWIYRETSGAWINSCCGWTLSKRSTLARSAVHYTPFTTWTSLV